MSARTINLLIASSDENTEIIKLALKQYSNLFVQHINNKKEIDSALKKGPCQVIISELEHADFNAFDLSRSLQENKIEASVILIEETGDEDIAIQCLESGACHFIQLNERYLKRLPALMDNILIRIEKEQQRRLIEQELIASKERYQDIFDNTSDLIQCLLPDGSFIYTNNAWREAMGYTEEEVRPLNLLDVLHPESMACCQDRFERLNRGESLTCLDFRFISKSGNTVDLMGDCGSIVKEGETISTRGIFRNITEKVQAEEALKISEKRYQALYENAPDIYTTINQAGEILSINRIGAHMLGFEVDELMGESAANVIHPLDQRAVFDAFESHFNHPMPDNGIEYRQVRKDGSLLWVHQRVSLEPDVAEPRLLVVCRDVTEKRKLEEQLAHYATHDALTNLINRREFERRLKRLLDSSQGHCENHALCYLDLDQFKSINDSCGHIAGDELLRQITALLQGHMRSRDTLARIGGDEFVILMEYCPLEKAVQLTEIIHQTIGDFKFHWRSNSFSIGVSIGLVKIQHGHTINTVIGLADSACYLAKEKGRNCIHIHDEKAAATPHQTK